VGGMEASHDAYQKGVRFLLRTQFEDGSWYVRSRAWPFQPHFESEFPHGKDQWISAGGTAWAAMALLLTQPRTARTEPRDWMSIKIADAPRRTIEPAHASAQVADSKRTVDFRRDIAPLLDRSCASCHGGEKRKGSFSIESRDSMIKGGQSGEPALQPGNSAGSRLVRMVTDQVEDLEMPPRSKRLNYPALNQDEVRLLRTWIDEGVEWKK
jgi:Planctomycete cytochrome C